MLTHDQKIKKIIKEMIDKNIFSISQNTIISYLYDELEKERELSKEYLEYFNENTTPNEINELLMEYHNAMAIMTKHYNMLAKENMQLKQKLKYMHELNSCLMYVIELGGVKGD